MGEVDGRGGGKKGEEAREGEVHIYLVVELSGNDKVRKETKEVSACRQAGT